MTSFRCSRSTTARAIILGTSCCYLDAIGQNRDPEFVGEALCDTVEEARAVMLAAGLVCLGREPGDDATIVESWI